MTKIKNPTNANALAGRPFRKSRGTVRTVRGLYALISEARDAGAMTTYTCTPEEAARLDKLVVEG